MYEIREEDELPRLLYSEGGNGLPPRTHGCNCSFFQVFSIETHIRTAHVPPKHGGSGCSENVQLSLFRGSCAGTRPYFSSLDPWALFWVPLSLSPPSLHPLPLTPPPPPVEFNSSPRTPISTLTAGRCMQTITYDAYINSPAHTKQH